MICKYMVPPETKLPPLTDPPPTAVTSPVPPVTPEIESVDPRLSTKGALFPDILL